MSQPNFIVFMTDDQGYGDLSCMGSEDFRTPHLDGLAADGVRFTSWYSNSPVCSPSRAALLSGKYPMHAGVKSILAGHRTATGLPQSTATLATALKPLGYRSYMTGKWHLGMHEDSQPHHHGFDRWFGHLAGCIDYFSQVFYWMRTDIGTNSIHDLWEDGQEIFGDGQYFTEMIADYAIKYLRDHAANHSDKPFFLFVPFNAPHYPMHAPREYMDRFPDLPWDRMIMAAMLSAVDDAIGRIMAEVERQGWKDQTFTAFTSDNGPSREARNWMDGTQDPYYGGSPGGLKGHKFSLYEGGIRMPALMNWPGAIPASQVSDEAFASMDIFPTMLTAAGGDPTQHNVDGTDILPCLRDGDALPERDLFWEMGDQVAMRRGPWKLVLNGRLVEGSPPEDDVHLANLEDDMAEANNLATDQPELTRELTDAAQTWRKSIGDYWLEHHEEPSPKTVTHPDA